jgi:hypothetical protein
MVGNPEVDTWPNSRQFAHLAASGPRSNGCYCYLRSEAGECGGRDREPLTYIRKKFCLTCILQTARYP